MRAETKCAADFVSDSNPNDIADFGDAQLSRTTDLVAALSELRKAWDASILPAVKPAAGKVRTLALRHLAAQCGLGGARWIDQFATGFPITGVLSQKGVFTRSKPGETEADPAVLFNTAEARFRERASKAGRENSDLLWTEALEQVEKGWPRQPLELAESGFPPGFPPRGYNVAFRFGAEQGANVRACDDLKHSLTNSACAVLSPIQLVSWGHLSQLCRRSCGTGRDWALLKADHEAAYKQLPIAPADQARAIIAPRRPVSGKWRGFPSRTLMFGATADVLRYNLFFRLLTALVSRLFEIPLICFFGDFAALIPRLLWAKSLAVFTSFCDILGIRLKPGKSEVGSRIAFIGLRGWFPRRENDLALHISLPGGKRAAWAALLDDFIRTRSIKRQELEKLIGRLSFSQTLLFGKFARTQLLPLYQELNRRVYKARLTDAETAVFSWRGGLFAPSPLGSAAPCAQKCAWLVYTDAGASHLYLCALRFKGTADEPRLVSQLASAAPAVWAYHFRSTCLIFSLELLYLVAFLEDEAPGLAGCSIWFYMGRNNSLSAMTRGNSNTAVIAVLVARAWELIHR